MRAMFDRVQLGDLQLKNRFVRSATRDGYADDQGLVTPALLQIYDNLARGGVGTIITGHAYVTDVEQSRQPGQMGIYDDICIAGYRRLTEIVHAHGVKIFMQMSCIGAQTFSSGAGRLIWGPSAVADLATGILPTEMTAGDIDLLQTAFGKAASRAKEAGFDGVQIHAAHGYVLNKFLSPYYNRRTDGYGGTSASRARMVTETYAAMRAQVGPNYPLLIKVNCSDFMAGGMEFADCRTICRILDEMGIDGIEVSGGTLSSPDNKGPIRTGLKKQDPYFSAYAAQLAEELHAPILLVGGNRDFAVMTRILNNSAIALFSLCRPLIHESDLINRWQGGDLRPARCIACNKCLGLERTVCILHQKPEKAV